MIESLSFDLKEESQDFPPKLHNPKGKIPYVSYKSEVLVLILLLFFKLFLKKYFY